MKYVFFLLFVLLFFCIILALELGLSIGIAYIIIWFLPDFSFETGVVIGALCGNFTVYFFSQFVLGMANYELNSSDRERTIDEIYNDHQEEGEYHIFPASSSARKRRRRRRVKHIKDSES